MFLTFTTTNHKPVSFSFLLFPGLFRSELFARVSSNYELTKQSFQYDTVQTLHLWPIKEGPCRSLSKKQKLHSQKAQKNCTIWKRYIKKAENLQLTRF